MNKRSVETVLTPPPPKMVGDGFKVHNFFPNGHRLGLRRMSPFFLLDYNAQMVVPPADIPRGVGVHPHRGFETVTIACKGSVAHHDSAGHQGTIREGEVQWMTAGAGILHKEYHEEHFAKTGGLFQMAQLWVNLPAAHKMTRPGYQLLGDDRIIRRHLPGEAGTVRVIAGSFEGSRGPASTFTPVELYDVMLRKNRAIDFHLPQRYNTGILLMEGSLLVGEEQLVPADHFILFDNDGDFLSVAAASEDTHFLVLSGEPIDEPVVAYGPFLMNTQEEIRQALDDYNHGGFGYLE